MGVARHMAHAIGCGVGGLDRVCSASAGGCTIVCALRCAAEWFVEHDDTFSPPDEKSVREPRGRETPPRRAGPAAAPRTAKPRTLDPKGCSMKVKIRMFTPL
eukprot:7092159-Prymnesium_polylepis.1